jgi:hypothetical protein
MMIRALTIYVAVSGACSMALAASESLEEQAACRPDVRRFCHQVKMSAGDAAFVECLKANRDKLSKECRAVLESKGQ